MDMEEMMGTDSADQDEHYGEAEKLIGGLSNPASLTIDQRLQLAQIHMLMSLAESAKVLADAAKEREQRRQEHMGEGPGNMNDMIRRYRG